MNRNTPWRTTRGNRIVALAQGHNDWYRIKNVTDGPSQLSIYDEIGFFGITAHDLISDLADVNGPIDVHLNSPGGEVNDGLAIYNCLMARDNVTIYIDGMAASIASVIAMAGDTIRIAPTGQMMIHNAFTMAIGDADDLRAMADRLDENTTNIAGIYAARTGKSAEHWLKVMADEGWYRGQEAVDAGLADELTELKAKGKAATFDLSVFRSRPETDRQLTGHLRAAVRTKGEPALNAAHHPYHSHTEPMHEPMTGWHAHNHAAFGCTDADDGIHAHSHYHASDATHGHDHVVHGHDHTHDEHPHQHAHEMGGGQTYGPHEHPHAHHDVTGGAGDDDTSAATDHDHDAWASTGPGMVKSSAAKPYDIFNADKYTQADRDRMAKSGEAMPDGSYPIADEEDLSNAIHAVGRGTNNSHSAIRRHITKRAHALGKSSMLPESWGDSGSTDSAGSSVFSEADAAALLTILKG
ncbi:MAG TPA: head maturation protease, ClpP-related [Planctomycetota bacterium]|nr:head maturation protease, ClpP-related [Planctomycetota bacterium]